LSRTAGLRAATAVLAYLVGFGLLVTLGPYGRVAQLRGEMPFPEETPAMSAERVGEFLETIGEEGRALYVQAQMLDFLVPVLTLVAAIAVLSWAGDRLGWSETTLAALVLLPILLACAETVENVLLILAARHHPGPPPWAGVRAGATVAKFLLGGATALTLAGAAIAAGLRSVRREV